VGIPATVPVVRLAVLAAIALLLGAAPLRGADPPPVDAAAYIVVDQGTGETLARKAADRELPMASTTKIMTALIVLERANLDDELTVPPSAAIEGSSGRLETGERLSVRELLTALLVASGNDAAVTLAEGVGGSQQAFVAEMNARARELGLTHTHFSNPHGLDAPGHHSSVRDLVKLAGVAMRDPFFRRTVSSRRASIPGPEGVGRRRYESENVLLDTDPEVDGVKTGMTDEAGFALVAHARRPALGVQLFVALIGAPSPAARARGGRRLLDWGFSQFARATVVPSDTTLGRVPVQGRPGTSVPYRASSSITAPLLLTEPVRQRVVVPARVRAPVMAGQPLGTVSVLQDGHVIGRSPLVAAEGAGSPSIWDRVRAGVEALVP
jgi:D-alanyl-D-alanine carboxypeptidase (penicillin-binding protein 5/6)